MFKEIKNYFSENVFVSDFEGKVKRPDENLKTISFPIPDKIEMNISEIRKKK